MPKELTAIEMLNTRSSEATALSNKLRDRCPTRQKRDEVDMKSYWQGEAIAFLDAQKIFTKELERLRNRWQNNMLTFDDFGVY